MEAVINTHLKEQVCSSSIALDRLLMIAEFYKNVAQLNQEGGCKGSALILYINLARERGVQKVFECERATEQTAFPSTGYSPLVGAQPHVSRKRRPPGLADSGSRNHYLHSIPKAGDSINKILLEAHSSYALRTHFLSEIQLG